ncbi:protein-export membrane protein SecF [Peptoclostridium acidaminophilum DSM 3953]|uniref:Protein-export membrane protein SecF n=1 Tax=Peptoclostridium acidaminophilum DSM 3953 TaxID=1286171 RepID=W8U5R5_PEPAC|nr:protein translocase subunit SecF [Peptoclostridium acidaminophilum]AHM56271.1 protein-export membrane protein SecF [Peptoclostridium acidaminophilum DSM 3953]
MKIIEKKKIWFGASAAFIVAGLIAALLFGFNYGIDFTGGTVMEMNLHKNVSIAEIKEMSKEIDSNITINKLGADKTVVQLKTIKDMDSQKINGFFETFKAKYNLEDTDLLKAEQIGPSVGNEIKNKAMLAVFVSTIFMLIYISFRFELSYGVAAIVSLVHDVLFMLAFYALFRIPLNSTFIAAILTVVGYSINDTIVVFDRIRENIGNYKKSEYATLANDSIKQTLIRTMNTSLTTIVTISALYIFGVDAIKEFTLPLIAGIMVGTYSSIFIASPVWVSFKQKQKFS